LLNTASEQSRAGRHDTAAASLERALQIEPRNAWLWHRLARARFAQGELEQAEQLAAKSNSFAADDRRLLVDNWLLIAEARRQRGDLPGALDAEIRAGQVDEGG
jgi:tetratricopeptide (TPR) repeat protein